MTQISVKSRDRDMAAGSKKAALWGVVVYFLGVVAETVGLAWGSTTWVKWGLVIIGAIMVLVGVFIFFLAARGVVHAASILTVALLLIGFGVLVGDCSAAIREGEIIWPVLIVGIVMILAGALLMTLSSRWGRKKPEVIEETPVDAG
jgi:hypothetical protein